MKSHGMIQSGWHFDGPENGLDAMIEAIDYYRYFANPSRDTGAEGKYTKLMDSIRDYNEVDCKTVWEITSYLRAHMT